MRKWIVVLAFLAACQEPVSPEEQACIDSCVWVEGTDLPLNPVLCNQCGQEVCACSGPQECDARRRWNGCST